MSFLNCLHLQLFQVVNEKKAGFIIICNLQVVFLFSRVIADQSEWLVLAG